MDTFLIDVPMPSMGATVNELTVVTLKIQPGALVAKGQKIGELESDKSIFEFESPCDGTVRAILAHPGEARPSGAIFLQIETSDASLQHLKSKAGLVQAAAAAAPEGSRRLDAAGDQARPGGRARPVEDHWTSRRRGPAAAFRATTSPATSRSAR